MSGLVKFVMVIVSTAYHENTVVFFLGHLQRGTKFLYFIIEEEHCPVNYEESYISRVSLASLK